MLSFFLQGFDAGISKRHFARGYYAFYSLLYMSSPLLSFPFRFLLCCAYFFFFSFFLRHQRKTLRREENCTRKRFSLISFFERKNLFHLKNHVDDGDEIKIMLRKLFFEYWSFLMRNYICFILCYKSEKKDNTNYCM